MPQPNSNNSYLRFSPTNNMSAPSAKVCKRIGKLVSLYAPMDMSNLPRTYRMQYGQDLNIKQWGFSRLKKFAMAVPDLKVTASAHRVLLEPRAPHRPNPVSAKGIKLRHSNPIASHCPNPAFVKGFKPMHSNPSNILYVSFRNLPSSESHWAVAYSQPGDNGLAIVDAFRKGTAIAVSDASGLSTAAFVLEDPKGEHRVKGIARVPGPFKSTGDSYRCELTGIYSSILVGDVLAKVHSLQSGSAVIACDNISTLRALDRDFKPDPSNSSFDLQQAIWKTLIDSPISWKARHVKGHQTQRPLSRLERLNVEMHKSAKDFWQHLKSSPTSNS
jgi:hypothetical protein